MDHGLSILVNVKNNKCTWTQRDVDAITAYVSRFDGKQVRVNFGPLKTNRTNKQNAYYWGIVLEMIAGETGLEPEVLHELFKDKFLGKQFVVLGDVEHHVPKSSTMLDTKQFTEYVERVSAYAAQELRINIPLPGEIP